MSIENNQMISIAAFGNDAVSGDSAYEIFWVWMPEIKGKDYDSIAEFVSPVFKQNGLSGIVASIKYEQLLRYYG